MRFPVRSMTLAACCAAAASAACSITDQSDQVFVVVHPSDSLLAHGIVQRGQRDTVYAEAFRRTGADSQRLPNVEFLWSTNDKNVATVENVGNGAAVITGVNAGFGTVSAQAVNFERSKSGNRTIRVAPPFIIDSVRPLAVRYGDKLSVYGVGIGNISVLELGFADLIRDDYSFTGSPNGVARQDYWVPFPSTTDLPVYGIFGGGQFFAAQLPDTVAVDSVDLFEPDSSSPAVIDINGAGGPRTVAGLPSLFFNPALYFEPVSSGGSAVDWQRFDRNDNAPVTIIVNSQVYGDTSFAYISDSLYSLGGGGGYGINPSGWYFSAGFQYCNGTSFDYFTQPRVPSFTVAFKNNPTPRMHLLQFYAKEGRYELMALHGYLPGAADIKPDRFEDNQLCWQADSTFAQLPQDSTSANRRHIVVGPGVIFGGNGAYFDSTLTISSPMEVDFYRFRSQPAVFAFDTLVTVQTKALTGGGVDPSDIDLFVFDLSGNFLGYSSTVGSTEKVTVKIGPGDYYVVVVDVAGQPTRYGMCIAHSTSCSVPGYAPPVQVTAKPHTWVSPTLAQAATTATLDRRSLHTAGGRILLPPR